MGKTFLAIYLNESDCTADFIDAMLPQFDKLIALNIDICLMILPQYYNTVKIALLERNSQILVKLYTAELEHDNINAIAKYLISVTGNRPHEWTYSINAEALSHDNVVETLPDKLLAINGTLSAAVTETGTFFGGSREAVANFVAPNSKQKLKKYNPKSLVKNNLYSFILQIKGKK